MHDPQPTAERARHRWWRAALGAFVLLLMAAGLFIAFMDSGRCPLHAEFVRFEKYSDNWTFAVLDVTNESSQVLQFSPNSAGTVFSSFVSGIGTNAIVWAPPAFGMGTMPPTGPGTNRPPAVPPAPSVISPHGHLTVRVVLPNDGRVGRVKIWCLPTIRSLPARFSFARPLWWRLQARRLKPMWAECEQDLQAPRMNADGSVQPPVALKRNASPPVE